MNNWDDFKFFLALYRFSTLKKASKSLGTDQATVGRRIYALEEKLKVKLFEKRSDGYFLTASGERIKETILEVERSFQSIDLKITGHDEKMEGVIRVAMPGALANHFVISIVKNFTEKYPAVEIQFLTGAEVLNLSKREADMAFRLVRPEQRDLIVRKIGDFHLGLYGSKNLFKKYGRIFDWEDLKKIPFVGLYDTSKSKVETLMLKKIKKYLGPQVITSSAWSSVYAALMADIGIGILPSFMTKKNSDLELVKLMGIEKTPLWQVMHPVVQKNLKFKEFSEFLIPAIQERI
jgi:DNA-binding transcriptional LysR family regulator